MDVNPDDVQSELIFLEELEHAIIANRVAVENLPNQSLTTVAVRYNDRFHGGGWLNADLARQYRDNLQEIYENWVQNPAIAPPLRFEPLQRSVFGGEALLNLNALLIPPLEVENEDALQHQVAGGEADPQGAVPGEGDVIPPPEAPLVVDLVAAEENAVPPPLEHDVDVADAAEVVADQLIPPLEVQNEDALQDQVAGGEADPQGAVPGEDVIPPPEAPVVDLVAGDENEVPPPLEHDVDVADAVEVDVEGGPHDEDGVAGDVAEEDEPFEDIGIDLLGPVDEDVHGGGPVGEGDFEEDVAVEDEYMDAAGEPQQGGQEQHAIDIPDVDPQPDAALAPDAVVIDINQIIGPPPQNPVAIPMPPADPVPDEDSCSKRRRIE